MATVATISGGLVAAVAAFAGGLVATPLLGQPATSLPSDAIGHAGRVSEPRPGQAGKISGRHSAAPSSPPARPARKVRISRSEHPVARRATGSLGNEHRVARHPGGAWWREHQAARHQAATGHDGTAPPQAASPAPRQSAASSALRCSGSSVMLPENYVTIASFLISHGYTKLAAAGIAGNMWQESKGDPESVGTGGGGLIGFTPLPAGYVTGNPAADLQTQLSAVLTYNEQWSQYIPALNAATSATQAADIYMNDFERPGIPAAANREGAAQAVAAACGM